MQAMALDDMIYIRIVFHSLRTRLLSSKEIWVMRPMPITFKTEMIFWLEEGEAFDRAVRRRWI